MEVGRRLGGGDEADRHIPELLVALTGDHQQRVLPQDPVHRLRVRCPEQLLLVLQDEHIELEVAGHDRRGPEQVRPENLSVPGEKLGKYHHKIERKHESGSKMREYTWMIETLSGS